jgi:two-component system nitrogen regulation response regulator NtrX
MKPKVLVIDDDAAVRDSLRLILEYEHFAFVGASSGPEGVALAARESPDVVLMDIRMPGMSGFEALAELRRADATLPVAIISGHGGPGYGMQAKELGAFAFIEKPPASDVVIRVVRTGLELRDLRRENRELRRSVEGRYEIVGHSAALRDVLGIVERAAPTNASVLLRGESGVGKELVARAIHQRSPRAGQRFIQVNCAAIPEELIESELFGHERGAFTGATEKQVGKFEQADKGTIFLDEVGDMSPKTQAKVLRVLQEQEVERLGSARTIKVDVRVVAATNKDLEEAIANGEFREDLYFRLNVIPIVVPPLRERAEDIPRLVEHFAQRAFEEHNLRPQTFEPAVVDALRRHPWRGNIRELRNTVERMLIMAAGERVTVADLPAEVRGEGGAALASAASANTGTLRAFKETSERAFLLERLRALNWNISKTAEALDTPRSNLYKKIEQYRISQDTDG